jgi:hypothetical protein
MVAGAANAGATNAGATRGSATNAAGTLGSASRAVTPGIVATGRAAISSATGEVVGRDGFDGAEPKRAAISSSGCEEVGRDGSDDAEPEAVLDCRSARREGKTGAASRATSGSSTATGPEARPRIRSRASRRDRGAGSACTPASDDVPDGPASGAEASEPSAREVSASGEATDSGESALNLAMNSERSSVSIPGV